MVRATSWRGVKRSRHPNHSILLNAESECPVREARASGHSLWLSASGDLIHFRCWCQVDPRPRSSPWATMAIGLLPIRPAFASCLRYANGIGTPDIMHSGHPRCRCHLTWYLFVEPGDQTWGPRLDGKPITAPLNRTGSTYASFPLLRRQHPCGRQRNLHIGERRVRAPHRARPQPRDHRQLPALVRLQIWSSPEPWPASPRPLGYRCPMRRWASSRIHCRSAGHLAPAPACLFQCWSTSDPLPERDSGLTGDLPANSAGSRPSLC